MATTITTSEILKRAIQKEIASRLLYNDLVQKMESSAAKDVFERLAQQELGHQTLLEQYMRGELKEGALSTDQAIDYKIAEHLDQPQISPDMTLKDIFLLAANREKASHEFYLSFAQIHPAGKVRNLLRELASQELEHEQQVEFLYTEVAFPQTDSG
jgi:rubrerythrin